LHWPYPPNPAEYQSPGVGLLVAMFAIALVFVVVMLYVAKSSGPHLHESETKLDEIAREEEERNKMTE
jgi:hypothetical protein